MPLAFLGRSYGEGSSIIGSFELPKIALLRTLVGVMAVLWVMEWALQHHSDSGARPRGERTLLQAKTWLPVLAIWLKAQPRRWLLVAALLYLGSTVLSTILSGSFRVSLWGEVPGQDSYSAYTVTAYVLLFGVIATHLRTMPQLLRLFGAITAMGILVAGYAVLQHYGHDFFDLMEPLGAERTSSTMGGPIFAGSVLAMTLPISFLAATLTLSGLASGIKQWWHTGLWTLILAVQMTALIFTLSRGPWFGAVFALAALLVLMLVFLGWRPLARAVVPLAIAGILTSIIILVVAAPEENRATGVTVRPAGSAVAERVIGLTPQLATGGLSGRIGIWQTSWDLITQRPWAGFDSLNLSFLRPIIGYGPELFRYSYLLESPAGRSNLLPSEASHAHNYFIHQTVEAGYLGLLASVGVFVAFFLAGGYQLIRKVDEHFPVHKLVLVGLLAVLAGRLLEQMVGVARVSDLMVTWVLLAVMAAIPIATEQSHAINEPNVPRRSEQRSRRPSRQLQSRTPILEPMLLWRIVAVVVVVAIVGSLIWVKNVNYVRAAFIADNGAEQSRNGDLRGALSSFDQSIDLAPDVSSYYLTREQIYQSYRANNAPSKDETFVGEETGPIAEEIMADRAYSRNVQWVEQRPLFLRAHLTLADSSLELARLKDDSNLQQQAIALYEESLELLPESFELLDYIAGVYLQLGQPSEALPHLEASLAVTKGTENMITALRLQSTAYLAMGQNERSIEIHDQAVSDFPGDADVYFGRGTTYSQLSQHQKAIADYDQAIQLRPDFPDAFFMRGSSYYDLGQHNEALADFKQATLLKPEFSLAFNNRGLANAQLGQLDQAIADFSEAIRFDPGLAIAYNNRGFTFRDLGLLQQAIDDLDTAISLDPQFQMAFYNRALANTLLGRDSAAEQDAQRSVELGFDPNLVAQALDSLKTSRK